MINAKKILDLALASSTFSENSDAKIYWVFVKQNGGMTESESGFLIGIDPIEGRVVLGSAEEGITVSQAEEQSQIDPSWEDTFLGAGDQPIQLCVATSSDPSVVKIALFPSPKNNPEHTRLNETIQIFEDSLEEEHLEIETTKAPESSTGMGFSF